MFRSIVNKILLILNLIAVILLIGAYLSIFVAPDKYPYLPFLGLAYPYIVGLNILFMLVWMAGYNKNFWLSAIAVLAGIGLIGRYVQVPVLKEYDKTPVKNTVKLMSFNVFSMTSTDLMDTEAIEDSLIRIIDESQYDIVCFQEFPIDNVQNLHDKLNASSHYSYHGKSEAFAGSPVGNVIFTRFPIIQSELVDASESSNPCQVADLKIDTDTVRIFNCHLQSTHVLKSDFSFLEQLFSSSDRDYSDLDTITDISNRLKEGFIIRSSQVDSVAAIVKSTDHRLIVCGDFNDTPISYAYNVLGEDLKDAFREAGKWTSATYSSSFFRFRIDYVFCDQSIDVISYKSNPVTYSDHAWLSTELRIPPINQN